MYDKRSMTGLSYSFFVPGIIGDPERPGRFCRLFQKVIGIMDGLVFCDKDRVYVTELVDKFQSPLFSHEKADGAECVGR